MTIDEEIAAFDRAHPALARLGRDAKLTAIGVLEAFDIVAVEVREFVHSIACADAVAARSLADELDRRWNAHRLAVGE
jgi:hypothetical protein